MKNSLVPIMTEPTVNWNGAVVPALVAAAGERASRRFLEFFAANIRNPHTRRAYARAGEELFEPTFAIRLSARLESGRHGILWVGLTSSRPAGARLFCLNKLSRSAYRPLWMIQSDGHSSEKIW